jgi:hypothetical protein
MLISEIQGWHYFISWDNPVPADSSAMLKALGALGKITKLQTKTTVALSPRASTKWRDVRNAIESNLHPKKGNAMYVNLRSGKAFQIGSRTKHLWKQVPRRRAGAGQAI